MTNKQALKQYSGYCMATIVEGDHRTPAKEICGKCGQQVSRTMESCKKIEVQHKTVLDRNKKVLSCSTQGISLGKYKPVVNCTKDICSHIT